MVTLGETTVRWNLLKDGATVSYERNGIVERRGTIVASESGYRLVDEYGGLLSEAEYGTDGSVRILDGDCHVVSRWSGEQLQSIAQQR